jgi:hypothetical protein
MKADARPNHLPNALAPLIALPHWVIWRWETNKDGKRTKVPYRPARPNTKASSTDPRTWSDFDTAVAAAKQANGIGFCLLNSGFGAFDIDHCRDAATGVIDPWAKELVARAGSYAEVTVSGTGLRIIGRAAGPKIHRKQAVADGVTLETYRKAERYIVMTGDVLPGSPAVLANLDAVMDAVVAELDASVKHEDTSRNGKTDAIIAELNAGVKHEGTSNNGKTELNWADAKACRLAQERGRLAGRFQSQGQNDRCPHWQHRRLEYRSKAGRADRETIQLLERSELRTCCDFQGRWSLHA